MKYLILIHSNPRSRQIWESFSDAQRADSSSSATAPNGAIEVAARIPEATLGLVEVRPVRHMSGLDM